MTETGIEAALLAHLAAMTPALPIVKPNERSPNAKPYLAFEVVRVSRRIPALANGVTVSRGFVQITVVHDANTGTDTAGADADAVAAHYPKLLKLAVTGGKITIMDTPEIREGFRDRADWRVPVRVPYQAISERPDS
jgi:hypothetical protein